MAALFHDAWHLATHVDGRLWKTLYTLLLRPGVLTQEYFAEHRARYLPPVRLYLVLSVLFFAFGSSGPTVTIDSPKDAADAKPNRGWASIFDAKRCDQLNSDIKWLEQPIRNSCRRNAETHGDNIKHAFFNNVPKMMFVFVPLMALAMMLLYWRPRHYYVEHLVFFLHNHAAVFLILLIETAFARFAALLGWQAAGQWILLLTCLYAVWYVYRAMRVYYGQGRILSMLKLGVVGFTYMIGVSITLLFTLIISIIIS